MSGIALLIPAQAHAQSAEAEALRRAAPIIADYLDVDVSRVVPEARIVEDLGADDLDRVELVMLMEDEFIVEISDEKLDRMVTVADLVAAAIGR
ncbi:MAG: acyl carrier protein [Mesorhizobium sp.]